MSLLTLIYIKYFWRSKSYFEYETTVRDVNFIITAFQASSYDDDDDIASPFTPARPQSITIRDGAAVHKS